MTNTSHAHLNPLIRETGPAPQRGAPTRPEHDGGAGPDDRALGKGKNAAPRWSFRLGTILGIELDVHATFVLLLAWIVVSHLAQGHGIEMALAGLALVSSVFAIVVLHELGHALMAKHFGIRTRNILLLPIGGVSSLERIPDKPSEELLVAIAGPAVNIVLAVALGAVVLLAGGPLNTGDLQLVGGSFLTKLIGINVSLAVFNLLPAFPMDGGRVLRAALALRMEYARATDVAARIGQGMAVLFGILGVFTNPMLLLIALFVWMGAKQESSAVRVREALRGVPVSSAMSTDFKAIAPDEPISRAAELIAAGFQHEFPVVDDGNLVGVVTHSDVVRGLSSGAPSLPVRKIMQQSFATAEPGEMIEHALARLQEHQAALLVVVKDGRIAGILTPQKIGELIMMEAALRQQSNAATHPTSSGHDERSR
jgi:Zn-dependent protease/CBS domain-containing protein